MEEGTADALGSFVSPSFSFVFFPLHTWGWPRDCWGTKWPEPKAPSLRQHGFCPTYVELAMLVACRLMRPRLRPCVGGLALFLGDQVLEPKLTLTTLCAFPLGQGSRKIMGEKEKKVRKRRNKRGREEKRMKGAEEEEEEGEEREEIGGNRKGAESRRVEGGGVGGPQGAGLEEGSCPMLCPLCQTARASARWVLSCGEEQRREMSVPASQAPQLTLSEQGLPGFADVETGSARECDFPKVTGSGDDWDAGLLSHCPVLFLLYNTYHSATRAYSSLKILLKEPFLHGVSSGPRMSLRASSSPLSVVPSPLD